MRVLRSPSDPLLPAMIVWNSSPQSCSPSHGTRLPSPAPPESHLTHCGVLEMGERGTGVWARDGGVGCGRGIGSDLVDELCLCDGVGLISYKPLDDELNEDHQMLHCKDRNQLLKR